MSYLREQTSNFGFCTICLVFMCPFLYLKTIRLLTSNICNYKFIMIKPSSYATAAIMLCFFVQLAMTVDNMYGPNSVFTIPYFRTFRPDLIEKSIGCNLNIVYSSYTHPDGLRDAAHIISAPYLFGGLRCQPKEMYVKVFGYAQNYDILVDPIAVADSIKRSVNGKFRNIIIDWKNAEGNLQLNSDFLNSLINNLSETGVTTYLKVPASYLCKDFQGKPYILSIPNAKRIIVETYGQDPSAYKNKNQIFLGEFSETQPTIQHPQKDCPRFPSYSQLIKKYPQIEFFIEKTLQQQEPGYLGDHFNEILNQVKGVYDKKVFYDAYPDSIIRL